MFLYTPLRFFREETTSLTRFDPAMETYEETFLCESNGTETKSKSKERRDVVELRRNFDDYERQNSTESPSPIDVASAQN